MSTSKIEDQGCATSAPDASLFVNSEGEVLRGEELVDCGTLDFRVLVNKHGVTVDDVVSYRNLPEHRKRAYEAAVAAEFPDVSGPQLDGREKTFLLKADAIRCLVDFGRFRSYAELRQDGSECIVVVTEFIGLVEDEPLWERIQRIRRDTEARLWVMDERNVREHSYRTDEQGEKIPGSDRYGLDHGKLERQVELSWRVEDKTSDEICQLLARLTEQNQDVWDEAGVGVC